MGEVDGLAVELIGPHHGLAGVARSGPVALVGDGEEGVVVADGADGLLDAAGEDGVGGSGQHDAELFVLLQVVVDDDVHENGGGRRAGRNHQ